MYGNPKRKFSQGSALGEWRVWLRGSMICAFLEEILETSRNEFSRFFFQNKGIEMKVSLNWLRRHVELPESAEEVAKALTAVGLEVEGMEESAKPYEKLVVA